MNGAAHLVIWGNWLGALASATINVLAAQRALRPWKWLYYAIAGFSVIYAASYCCLLLNVVGVADWSRIMRIFSLTVWPVVWCGGAVFRIRYETKLIDETAKAVVERLTAA